MQPLALAATHLALLQHRPALPAPGRDAAVTLPPATPAPPPATGRGSLVDLLV